MHGINGQLFNFYIVSQTRRYRKIVVYELFNRTAVEPTQDHTKKERKKKKALLSNSIFPISSKCHFRNILFIFYPVEKKKKKMFCPGNPFSRKKSSVIPVARGPVPDVRAFPIGALHTRLKENNRK